MDEKNSVQYPITKIYNGDTVVIMTLQQGKDMNRKFIILRDSVKAQKKRLDTLHQTNDFLVDYVTAIKYKNSISSLQRRAELDQIKYTMGKSESEFKLDLYKLEMQSKLELFKSEMQTKTELFNSQLESEKRNSTHRARQSAILGGLVVGGIAITGAMIIGWMPSTWFK
jgi:hypothetical protein